ncbi:MAG: 16S rRNA (guanine(527)-N(7))-methyltransferase RsmG [Clostridia bacterium]|nr:16S rRNA (guanine(527)-N(7))-methyltransferase RsmG [Clostridia bacterium]
MSVSEHLKQYGVATERELEQFDSFAKLLVETNKKFNLTALTDDKDAALLHFYDSLSVRQALPCRDGLTLIDVGCGAGFPSMPLAITMPCCQFTMMDSTAKKLTFISESAAALGLSNVKTLVGRAEEFSTKQEYRESFDVGLARGVARLNILAELVLPFVKVGGSFVAMKGRGALEEVEEAKNGIAVLGGKLEAVIPVAIPETDRVHNLVVIKKIAPTPPQYPRQFGRISKKPL